MTIKETAGKILILLYYLQRTEPMKLDQDQIFFQADDEPELETDSSILSDQLHEVTSNDAELYNACIYLLERGFIESKNKGGVMGGLLILGPHVTYQGVDIIECVEQGEESQKVIKSLFNFSFKFSPTMKVDSIIKAEVGNIVGIGGAISGKVDL